MKLSYVFLGILLAVIVTVSITGFRGMHSTVPPLELFPDMNYQDKVKDQQPSAFFADGRGDRPPISGTVAEEMPGKNDYWSTGKWDATHWGNGIPIHESIDGDRALQIDDANMARGRERYDISCAVCHGAAGDGQGVVTKYGLNNVASYHVDRLRQEPDGQLFDTISNGKGQMLGYGYNISIDDRWRIVMYVRALQRSQNAPLSDATPEEQAQLDKTRKPAAGQSAPQGGAPAQEAAPAQQAAPAAGASEPSPAPNKGGPLPNPHPSGNTNEPGNNTPMAKPPGGASIQKPGANKTTATSHHSGIFITGDHGEKDEVMEYAYPTSFEKPHLNNPSKS